MKVEIFDGEVDELADAFAYLVPQLSKSNPPPGVDFVQAMLGSDAITQFVARDDGGRIVGVATLVIFPIPTAWRAWIEDVIVDESTAGRGIGTALTEAMLEHARAAGCKTVDLTSRPKREAANHMYRKLGFVQRDTNVYRYDLNV
ncbi:MAG TPA: GNAT family N-acetyltransferase [Acidimicrobiales bacterium]|jgi:ribosomal protein S18 acetylase RimI-like enzyme|nr:GNAT family N-acetyltransferase [Acidimicrobiales bacterium]